MGLFRSSRFTRRRDGTFKLSLGPDERALLAALPDQLESILTADDPGMAGTRLFPTAYASDPELDGEYHRLMREELVRARLETLATMRDTVTAERLTPEDLDAWIRAVNDARLVIGTLLDVSEEEDPLDVDPEAPDVHQRIAYVVLSSIVADAIDALTGA